MSVTSRFPWLSCVSGVWVSEKNCASNSPSRIPCTGAVVWAMMAGEQLHACEGHGIQVGLFPGGHCNSRKNSWHFCFIVSTKFLWFAKRQVLREKEFAVNDLQTVSRSFSRYRNPQQDLWKGQLWFRGYFTLGNNLVLTLHTSNLFSDDWLHIFNWKDKNAIKKNDLMERLLIEYFIRSLHSN